MYSVNWPIVIAIYLFIAGMGVAAFYTGMLANLISGGKYEQLAKVGSYIAVPSIILGLLMLIIDLGRPLFFWHFILNFNPTSTMSIGTWLLTLFTILAGIYMLTWLAEEDFANEIPVVSAFAGKIGLRKFCGIAALPISLMVAGYTGVLLASTSAELWNSTPFLGVLFLFSATSTGIAALILAYVWKVGDYSVVKKLAKADVFMIIMEVIVIVLLVGSLKSQAPEAAGVIFGGSYSLLFWLGIVACGLVVPFIAEMIELFSSKSHGSPNKMIPVLSGLFVLAGGFLLRYVMLYAGQV